MATGFTVEAIGLPGIRRKIGVMADLKPVAETIDEASLFAQGVAVQGAPRDTAGLQRSIQRDVSPFSASVYSIQKHASVMEFGRRPGAKMPPPSALEGWARRHGFAGGTFVLARSIARRGIKGRFFMKAAREATIRELPRMLNRLAARLERQFRDA